MNTAKAEVKKNCLIAFRMMCRLRIFSTIYMYEKKLKKTIWTSEKAGS